MSSISVDHATARTIIETAWGMVDRPEIRAPAVVVEAIEEIMRSRDVTFKYILVTGLLGKCADRRVHPRALQTSSTLKHSYDARSLCHGVVVPFEKEKGDLWGLSNEPFVNKPARHPEHSKDNAQLRNRVLAERLHTVLEHAHKAPKADTMAMLVQVLRLGRERAASAVSVAQQSLATLPRVLSYIDLLLGRSDGGTRLAASFGAFVSLLNEGFDVRVYPPNYSDRFAKTAGDVEIRHGEQILSAAECKHRPISLDDVRHGLKKAKGMSVPEYYFVAAAGLVAAQEEAILNEISSASAERDVLLLDFREAARQWAMTLNPLRRARFAETVVRILRDEMHRAEVANEAAQLWNDLE